MKSANRYLLNITLSFVSMFFCIAALELLTRIFYPCWDSIFQHKYISYDVSRNTFLGKPGFKGKMQSIDNEYDVPFSLDENGYRNSSENSLQEASIFFLGDSFGFGWGVNQDEVFSSITAKSLYLKEANLSVPGTDLVDYLIISRNFIRNAEGKIIVTCVTFENDILQYPDPQLAVKRAMPKRNTIIALCFKYSAFVNLMAKLIHRNKFMVDLIRRSGGFWGNSPLTSNLDAKAMEASLDILNVIKDELKPKRFVVVLVPPRPQFNLGTQYRTFVKEVSNRRGFEVVDPTIEDNWEKDFFTVDGHWTKEAHQKVGRLLANKLGA